MSTRRDFLANSSTLLAATSLAGIAGAPLVAKASGTQSKRQ
jgi:hypothetical protein